MGITLHTTSEKKAKSINIDESLYQLPVHFEVVERVVPIQQENFVIYQEKKTTATKAAPQRQQAVERKVVYMEQEKPQAVAVMEQVAVPIEENGKIIHNLDSYLEMEEMLTQARSPQRETEEEEF